MLCPFVLQLKSKELLDQIFFIILMQTHYLATDTIVKLIFKEEVMPYMAIP